MFRQPWVAQNLVIWAIRNRQVLSVLITNEMGWDVIIKGVQGFARQGDCSEEAL